jgi:hypothetical protein
MNVSDPPDGPTLSRGAVPSPAFGEKASPWVKYVMRNWNCRNCGKANKTEVAMDGTVKCDFCTDVMRIQPSRFRGGEAPGQLPGSLRGAH